jgi:nitrite reductase/ring-hydroxylating ferredoxin subunit
VIHPRDCQEETPFAELKYPVPGTRDPCLKQVREYASLTSERRLFAAVKGAPMSKAAECCEEVTMATFVKVAKAADVEPACGKALKSMASALFNVEGTLYAIDDTCTHRGGPLSEGELNGNEVSCPWHGARFDVTSGSELSPPAPNGVARYSVRVDGEDVAVEV